MSEIIELNGFGSQDWPNRANNTDPVITTCLPFLLHPAGRVLHHGRTACTQAVPAPSSQASILTAARREAGSTTDRTECNSS